MGIEYQISYTWSHGMSDSIGYYGDGGQSGSQSAYMQNLYDRRSEWSPYLADAKHNFVASYLLRAALRQGQEVRIRLGASRWIMQSAAGSWAAISAPTRASR